LSHGYSSARSSSSTFDHGPKPRRRAFRMLGERPPASRIAGSNRVVASGSVTAFPPPRPHVENPQKRNSANAATSHRQPARRAAAFAGNRAGRTAPTSASGRLARQMRGEIPSQIVFSDAPDLGEPLEQATPQKKQLIRSSVGDGGNKEAVLPPAQQPQPSTYFGINLPLPRATANLDPLSAAPVFVMVRLSRPPPHRPTGMATSVMADEKQSSRLSADRCTISRMSRLTPHRPEVPCPWLCRPCGTATRRQRESSEWRRRWFFTAFCSLARQPETRLLGEGVGAIRKFTLRCTNGSPHRQNALVRPLTSNPRGTILEVSRAAESAATRSPVPRARTASNQNL
jgi:hypothetical protein